MTDRDEELAQRLQIRKCQHYFDYAESECERCLSEALRQARREGRREGELSMRERAAKLMDNLQNDYIEPWARPRRIRALEPETPEESK